MKKKSVFRKQSSPKTPSQLNSESPVVQISPFRFIRFFFPSSSLFVVVFQLLFLRLLPLSFFHPNVQRIGGRHHQTLKFAFFSFLFRLKTGLRVRKRETKRQEITVTSYRHSTQLRPRFHHRGKQNVTCEKNFVFFLFHRPLQREMHSLFFNFTLFQPWRSNGDLHPHVPLTVPRRKLRSSVMQNAEKNE